MATAGLLLGQVIKHHAGRRLVGITRRVVRGSAGAIAAVLAATGTGTGINTAYIERLNATFRAALSPLTRRGRAIARSVDALTAGMYLVGCAYNFCWAHDSLRIAAGNGQRRKWGRPNSRVTRGHLGQSSGIRAFMSSSKRPYGFTCSQISGVSALRSRGSSFCLQCGCASTCWSMSVLT